MGFTGPQEFGIVGASISFFAAFTMFVIMLRDSRTRTLARPRMLAFLAILDSTSALLGMAYYINITRIGLDFEDSFAEWPLSQNIITWLYSVITWASWGWTALIAGYFCTLLQ